LMSLLKVCGALNSMGVSINEVILGEEGGVWGSVMIHTLSDRESRMFQSSKSLCD
jgi:hypothetical protein